jgi:hypothetical protein
MFLLRYLLLWKWPGKFRVMQIFIVIVGKAIYDVGIYDVGISGF